MKKVLLIAVSALLTLNVFAQNNPVLTAMPSMSITPDARGGGMGDLGTATTPDMTNNYWNVAKWAFTEQKGGISASYTPWLRKIVSDINLAHLEGWYNISDRGGAVSASFSYFKMGEVGIYGQFNEESFMGYAYPNEWAIDLGYSRKLHDYVSMGVALRFLYSDLSNGFNSEGQSETLKPAWTMAADLGLYYSQPIDINILGSSQTSYFRLGFTLKNLGGKMTYDGVHSNFIPTSINLGLSYELPFDKYNKLTFNFEAHKYLVPTKKNRLATYEQLTSAAQSKWEQDATGKWQVKDEFKDDVDAYEMNEDAYSDISAVKGIFMSFHDAPGGVKEEFREIAFGVGVEYTYNRQFYGRLGYSHEDKYKGNRRLFELGAGFHLSIVNFDVAYTIAAASNPLDQTMRFTLGFDIAGIQEIVNNKRR